MVSEEEETRVPEHRFHKCSKMLTSEQNYACLVILAVRPRSQAGTRPRFAKLERTGVIFHRADSAYPKKMMTK